jgi:hypothetical protein
MQEEQELREINRERDRIEMERLGRERVDMRRQRFGAEDLMHM